VYSTLHLFLDQNLNQCYLGIFIHLTEHYFRKLNFYSLLQLESHFADKCRTQDELYHINNYGWSGSPWSFPIITSSIGHALYSMWNWFLNLQQRLVQATGCPKYNIFTKKHFKIFQNFVVSFLALCDQDQGVKFTLQHDIKLQTMLSFLHKLQPPTSGNLNWYK